MRSKFLWPSLLSSAILFSLFFAFPTLGNIVYYNFPDNNDYQKFPSQILKAASTPFRFKENLENELSLASFEFRKGEKLSLPDLLEQTETLAFVIIQNDTIRFEKYYDGYSRRSTSMSFSLAKSFLSALTGMAIRDGYIDSVDRAMVDFLPEFKGHANTGFSIKHLLQMTTGMDYLESAAVSNAFGIHSRLYYTSSLEDELKRLTFSQPAGKKFRYQSGEYALLGWVLSRALEGTSISQYLQEKLWSPLGMEYDGSINFDHLPGGLEKMWCCMAATAVDFARFGRLYLNRGQWKGKQIVPKQWVDLSTRKDSSDGSSEEYQYGWWIPENAQGTFLAEGLKGQFIHVNPKAQTIIVRLAKSRGGLSRKEWTNLFIKLSGNVET